MAPINILITGATGYIGGSVLSALLDHPRISEFNITALIRSSEKASRFDGLRVTPVIGSHDDFDLLKNLASQSDVVLGCADADNLNAAKAILCGLKEHHRNTLTTPIYIHTSGIAVLADDAQGNYASDTIYSDLNVHLLESLPRTQLHKEVDVVVSDAGEEGDVKTCIIYPALVYGIAKTPLTSRGIQNSRSLQIPAIIQVGLDRHQGGVIGKGLNIWSHVHIEDLTCLYMYIFDAAINTCRLYTGRIGIYFGENGECEAGEIFKEVAKQLSARGCGDSQPTLFSPDEIQQEVARVMGADARARGERARSIGWRPIHGTQDMLQSIQEEVAASMYVRSRA